ncbi:Transmembrane protein 14C [Sorochytrium milnesiophthora]
MPKDVVAPHEPTNAVEPKQSAQPADPADMLAFSDTLDPHLDLFAFSYAGLAAIGALWMYLKGGSEVLMIASACASAPLFFASHLLCQNPRDVMPFLGLSLVLMVVSTVVFYQTFTFVPGGWMSLNSAIMLLRYGERLLLVKAEKAQKNAVAADKKTQ